MTPRTTSSSSGSDPNVTAEETTAHQEKAAVPKQATAPEGTAAPMPLKTAVADKAVAKKAAEKAVAKKAVAKKATAKKAAVKKAAVKKATAKKAPAKKATAKTASAEKAVAKKATAKTAAAKTAAAKTAAAKKTTAAKSASAKKTAPAKKTTAAKKAPATKATTPKKKTAAKKTTPQPRVATPALAPVDRDRLLTGTHHDPHSVLGAHPAPDGSGVIFRAFRPYALSVTVVADDLRTELHDDGDGFFSGLLPLTDVPEYRLSVEYEGTVLDTEDPYRFLPTLGDLDLHLIGEGRHEQLWRALGAEPMMHQGVTGTRFTVWAPNARGVSLAGGFNYWDGTGFPMRSLGGTGVWELFVPGIGEGELYKFEITRPDGSKTLRADPLARRAEAPPDTSSIVHASHYEWGDAEWLERRGEVPVHEAPFSVYEVHLPSWRPGLTYRQLADQLPAYVRDLG
ncbi:GlgB N-terminal domain-containing protein, partial [Streptomyces spinoverrucosus]